MTRKSFPVMPAGGELKDLDQPGYYPGYSTLAQKKSWEEATRTVVTQRVQPTSPLKFFSPEEATLLGAVVDRVIPQDDRTAERTIPILSIIDQRLHENALNGFRYEDMPPDQEAYRWAIAAIGGMANDRFQQSFADLTVHRQELILKSIHDGRPDPENAVWQRLPIQRFWAMLMEDCVTAYYSHPWAWDEIGFGGPAYPRGYMRLENGLPEPWEKEERRYEWNTPGDSFSGMAEDDARYGIASPREDGESH